MNSLFLSFTCSRRQYSSSEADLQSGHRSRIGVSADGEPKGCGGGFAMTRVLAHHYRRDL